MIAKIQRRLLTTIFCALLGLIFTLNMPMHSQETSGLQLALEGQKNYARGQLDKAANLWQQAAEAFASEEDRAGVTKSLINKSQALQDLGLYPKACRTLLQGFEVDNPTCSNEQLQELLKNFRQQKNSLTPIHEVGLRSLGDVLRRQGRLGQSREILKLSLTIAQDNSELSSTLLSLGNLEQALGNQTRDRWDYEQITEIIDRQSVEGALQPYQAAIAAYDRISQVQSVPLITQLQGQLNHLSLLLDIQQWWQQQTNRRIVSWLRLDRSTLTQRAKNFLFQLNSQVNYQIGILQVQIASSLNDLPPSHQGIYAQVKLAQNLMRLSKTEGVKSLLTKALQQSRSLKDRRAESYVLGYLGQYYSQDGQLDKGIAFTRQALIIAQEKNINGDAREISYLWQSQLGQLLKQQGKIPEAIAAYNAAFTTLQSLRIDLNGNNQVVQFNFREEVRPVYLALTDLLLRSDISKTELKSLNSSLNSIAGEKFKENNNLELARQTIESLQLAELDNFFQDPCSEVEDIALKIDDIDPQAAVIYPIILPDRIEVILSLPGQPLKQFTTAIAQTKVDLTLDRLSDTLYNKSVDNSAINIFSTISLDPEEVNQNIRQLLPILGQIYTWLIQPLETDLESNQIKTLVFVLNDKLQNVPMSALYSGQQYLLEKYSIALVPSLQLTDSRKIERQELKVLAAGVSQQVEVRGEIFPALSNVPQELNRIEQAFPGSKQLLNEQFTVKALKNQLKSDFPAIHLATHGLFSSNPQQTYIVTGDKNAIGIDQLNNLLNTESLKPPELLVLSACETAIGDEQAILGLAGVAVRSGTRSTMATLWSVSDASTAQLMGKFYQEYKQPEIKKVDALQKAQLSLLESLKTNPPLEELKNLPPHPYYWSPYVLVGNWQ